MKKQSVVLLVLAIVFGWGVSTALAATYVSGNLGAVWLVDSDLSISGEETPADMTFDDGYAITGAIGYAVKRDIGYGYRGEIELGYRANDIDELTIPGVVAESIEGDISTISLMVNGFIDFMTEQTVSPFIGAGIGLANIEGDLDYLGSEDDNVFAYQVAGGVAFAVNQNMTIDVQYRYFATEDPEFDGLEGEYGTHNAMLGMRYSF